MPDSARTPSPAAAAPRPSLSALDILAFVVEVFALVSLAVWGFTVWPFPWNIVAGITAPVVGLVVWALFVAPRAVFAVHPFVRAVVELLVYLAATLAWWHLGATWVGVVFALVAVTVGVLAGRRRFA